MKKRFGKVSFIKLIVFITGTFPLWYFYFVQQVSFFNPSIPLEALRPSDGVTSVQFQPESFSLEFRNRGGFFFRREQISEKAAGIRVHIASLKAGEKAEEIRYLAGKSSLTLLLPGEDSPRRVSSYQQRVLKKGGTTTVFFPFPDKKLEDAKEVFFTFHPNISDIPFSMEISEVEVLSSPVNWFYPGVLGARGKYQWQLYLQDHFPWTTLENTGFWNFAGIYLLILGILPGLWGKSARITKMVFPFILGIYVVFLGWDSFHHFRSLQEEKKILRSEMQRREVEKYEASLLTMIHSSPYNLNTDLFEVISFVGEREDAPKNVHVYRPHDFQQYFLGTLLHSKNVHHARHLRDIPPGEWVLLSFNQALDEKAYLEEAFRMVQRTESYLIYRRL